MCYSGGSVRGDRTKESQMSQRTLQMFYVQCTLIRRWYSYVANYSSASGKRQSLYNVSLYQNKDSSLVHLQWMLNGSEQPWLWCSVLDTYLMLLNQFFFHFVDLWILWWLNCKCGSLWLMHGSIRLAENTFLVFCILCRFLAFLTTVHLNYFSSYLAKWSDSCSTQTVESQKD